MNKEEVIIKLAEMGLEAVLTDNVIMFTVRTKKAVKGAKNALESIGYKGSWGHVMKKKGNNAETKNGTETKGNNEFTR